MIIYDYKVGDFMTKNIKAVDERTSALDIAKKMTKFNIGSVVVMKNKDPVGIITDTDLVRKVVSKNKNPEKVLAKDIMTKSVITITPETSLRMASTIMASNKVRRLPVIDKDKGLVGIVTETDLTRILAQLKQPF